jgi:pimeloyl-ACP methyl ester carboxylesterase
MPTIDINGIKVHYQQAGRGHDLVMVHGLLSSLAFWYLDSLPILARDFRVTVYDLRGHGLTAMPQRGYTSRDLAGDLNRLCDRLGIDRAHLVGHSYGGAVALQFALLRPQRVASLVAADALVPGLPPSMAQRGSERWQATMDGLRKLGYDASDDMPRVAFGLVEEVVRHPDGTDAKSLLATKLNPRSHAQRRWSQLMTSTTAPRELSSPAGLTVRRIRTVGCPTLVLYGENSFARPTQRALERNLRGCRSAVIPDGGHLFPAYDPHGFAQAVGDFVTATSA